MTRARKRRFLFEPLEERRVLAVAFVDPNPAPGNQFGNTVVALSTGNVVITSPFDDAGGVNAGAVYLFNGTTGELISTLRGSNDFDVIGNAGVTALASGNFVIGSPSWQSGGQIVGAATWGSGLTGVSGTISASNSLVGSSPGDAVGSVGSVHELTNGNYVVRTPSWDNGATVDAGAATWGNGITGVTGTISPSNSLVGLGSGNSVGSHGVKALSNGNYVVISSAWGGGAGAVTLANGATGIVGAVNASNSLVGTGLSEIGSGGVYEVGNGNFVVLSPSWDNGSALDAGAATWGNGTTGIVGTVAPSNSLVGSTTNDHVGLGITVLTNGNYVVRTTDWDNGTGLNAGAATWGSGAAGVTGVVSAANSLVGLRNGDMVANQVVPLSNGNYVVNSPSWDAATNSDVGAVTWASGTTGRTGIVDATNSLVGTVTSDRVGANNGVVALTNGNYVVASAFWDNGPVGDAGAVTWANGSTGLTGPVTAVNSLVGSSINDWVGFGGVTPLTNGNYVVSSPLWKTGSTSVGAVTWRNGTSGGSGVVSAANSLVGSSASDFVGDIGSVTALTNGNYVISSPNWNNGPMADVGAVTWGNGSVGSSGAISSANSLVGSTTNDRIGNNGIIPLVGGNYVVTSTTWDNASIVNAGAATWGNGATGISGPISPSNSLVGSQANDQVGINGVVALANGNYIVSSANWDNGALLNAGAVSWSSGTAGVVGPVVTPTVNHVKGGTANTGLQPITLDNVNGNFFARFTMEGTGVVRVGSQATGFDVTIPGTLAASFSTGNLTITDVDGGGKDNNLTVRLVNVSGNDYYEFTEVTELFTSAPATSPASTLSNGNKTLRVPASAITGALTVNLLGGNDLLTIDLTGGDVIPTGGLTFNGSAPVGIPGDRLHIVGGNQGTVTYNYTNASDGNVVLSTFGTVNYTGLDEGLRNTGSATDVVINLPVAGSTATWSDDGTVGNLLSRLSAASFVTTEFTNPSGGVTFNRGNSTDSLTINSLPDFNAALTVGTSAAQLNNITFAGAITLAANKSLTAFANNTISLPNTISDLALSGSGVVSFTSTRNIALSSGASIVTTAGSITLDANQQASASLGDFVGVNMSNAAVTSTSGAITVRGRGGQLGVGQQQGVRVAGGAVLGGNTTATVTVNGVGGASTGHDNYGVWVTGANSAISSGGGNIVVTGTGGGSGNSSFNYAVNVNAGGKIAALGNGSVTVTGTSTTGAGNGNIGVNVFNANSAISAANGAVQLTGTGGGSGASQDGWGVFVGMGANATAGGTSALTIIGTGGSGSGGPNHGVYIHNNNTLVGAGSGGVNITGAPGNGVGTFGVSLTGIASLATTSNGPIQITTNSINIENTFTVSAGTGNVTILQQTNGQQINFGAADSAGVLGLTDAELDRVTGGLVQIGNGNSGQITVSAAISHGNALSLTTGAGITINNGLSLAANKNLTATATGTIGLLTANASVTTSGTGTIGLTTARSIFLATGASINSASGSVTLDANQQATPTSGDFQGIDVHGTVNSTSGSITLRGKGGNTLASQIGVRVSSGGVVGNGTTGLVTVLGTGGASTVTGNAGVLVTGGTISSAGGNVVVTGQGGGSGGSSDNVGVAVSSSGVISAGVAGTVTIAGTGGATTGSNNYGVHVNLLGSMNSSGGAVQVTGTGGAGSFGNNYGVFVASGGFVSAGGTAVVTVTGNGANTTTSGSGNTGIVVDGSNSRIQSTGGNVNVTGRGGGLSSVSGNNVGVATSDTGRISAGGSGATNVTGFGGGLSGNGSANVGVSVGGRITSAGGPVHVIGTAGGGQGSNVGIGVAMNGGSIDSQGSGTVTVEGYGNTSSTTTGSHHGINLMASSTISSTSGNVVVIAVGGNGTGQSVGLFLQNSSITVGIAASVAINATGGTGSSLGNYAVRMFGGTNLIRGGNGGVNIVANAPDGATPALSTFGSSAIMTSAGIGLIQISTDGIDLGAGSAVHATTNTVTITPRQAGWGLALGGADAPGVVAITDAENDAITAGTLVLGNAATGTVNITAPITRTTATVLQINSAAAINFVGGSLNSNGGNITLNPGTLVSPATSGIDVTTGAGTLAFGNGDDLAIAINGATVDTEYTQLNVQGVVNLTNVDLVLSGDFVPTGGEVFTIVDNDGTDPIIGTFTGLPHGTILSTNFFGSGLRATIGYFGGTGNDVVITVQGAPGTTTVEVSGGNLIVTDAMEGDTNDLLTITRVGSNLRITDLTSTVEALDGATQINANTVEVPLASITAWQVNTLAGNDSLTIDFSGGNPLPTGGVVYNAGSGTGDVLILTGGATTAVAHTVTSASNGSVTLTGPLAGTITYTGLEPITDSLTVTDRTFTLNAGAETVTLADATGANQSISSSLGRTITFSNPSASLTIDAAAGNDTITIASVDSDGPFNASLIIQGGAGDDTVNLNADITFAAHRNLDVDLQNDHATPGLDNILVAAGTNLILSGNGSATLTASRSIVLATGSSLVSADGTLTLEANQQTTPSIGNFAGISLDDALLSTIGLGDIVLVGRGGDSLVGSQYGIAILGGTVVSGGTSGLVSLTGHGGAGSGNGNVGVRIADTETSVTSIGANVQITGQGNGTGTGSLHHGVVIAAAATVSAGATGTVTVVGTGGPTSGGNHHGIMLQAATVTSGGGNVQLTGVSGANGANGGVDVLLSADPNTILSTLANGGSITVSGNNLAINSAITTNFANSVTLKPVTNGFNWNLGVDLTDAELDLISTGTLRIGSATMGSITISAPITRPSLTVLNLVSGLAINFTTGSLDSNGGNVLLDAGTGISPASPGVDVRSGTGNLTFGDETDLVIVINGPAPDSQLQRLNFAGGSLNLTGLDLAITGSHVPLEGETFTIVVNDDADPIIGTFNDLPEGATISGNFLGSGLGAVISYVGGTGNDVVITVLTPPATTSIELVSGNLIVTDIAGGDTNDTLTITRVGPNIRITDPNNRILAMAGATQVDPYTVNVPFASVTGSLQVNTLAGNDTLTVDFAIGNPLPPGGLVYAGGAGTGDALVLSGALTTTVSHLITNATDGSIVLEGDTFGTINYTGVEPITDSLESAHRHFTFTPGADVITLTAGPDTKQTLTHAGNRTITFFNPNASLTLNGSGGNDVITIDSFNLSGPFNASLTINGGTGSDTVNINADIIFAPGRNFDLDLQNDDAAPGIDTINFGEDAGLVLTGTGSATLKASGNISFADGSSITTINGNLLIEANQQALASAGDFVGISLDNAFLFASGTGTVTLAGRGGDGAAGNQIGISIANGSSVSGGTSGLVSLNGRGGQGAGNGNSGIVITGAGTSVTSTSAAIQMVGQGGGGTGSANQGVIISNSALISAGNNGPLTITGTGGSATGGNQHGVHVLAATVTSGGGNIQVTGQAGASGGVDVLVSASPLSIITTAGGGGSISLIGDNLSIANTISTNLANSVTLRPRTNGAQWNLGVDLTDTELDFVSTGTLHIGDANTGTITISAPITRPALTHLNLTSAAAINFTTGSLHSNSGNVTLNPGTSVSPASSGVDVNVGAGTLAFGAGDDLVLQIAGTAVDLQYHQLNVVGGVNLTGLDLVITGTAPTFDDTFVIVNNDGGDPVIGTFNDLPEGAGVLVNGVYKKITYVGGDGNDVALVVATNLSPTINAIANRTINEDASLQTVSLAGITAGGAESQALRVTASSDDPTLIPHPTVSYTSPNVIGSLSFTPVPDANGVATITVTVRDAGLDETLDTPDDGITTINFTVTVTAINDQPSFVAGANQLVLMNSGAQTVFNWATAISAGPVNESSQALTFIVTGNSNPDLFAVLPAISSTGNLTYTPATDVSGTATILLVLQDNGGTALGGVDTTAAQTFTITVGSPNTLRVNAFTQTTTGFIIEFNRALNPAGLNLYDTQGGGIGPVDVVLQRATVGAPNVRGSLIVDPTASKITFVTTNGRLPADNYTLTLRSAADGFVDTLAELLDGDSNGVAGDNFVHTFTVDPTPGVVVISIPNFARGPQQTVNLPATGTGIPVSFSDGGGLLSARFQLRYDPTLLNITGATVAAGLPAGTFVSFISMVPGIAEIQFISQDPLPAGTTRFVNLQATVPSTAPYRDKHVLDITNIVLSDNIPGVDDDAVHVVAYFGDTTANGTYNAADASRISRVAVGLDGGFEQFRLLDPVIIGDSTLNGALTAADASRMLQVAVAFPVPDIPPLPMPAVSLTQGGPDPKLSIPRDLSAQPGDAIRIPVMIDSIVDLTGDGLDSADLVLYYDPAVLNVTSVNLGSLLSGGNWMIAANVDPLAGRIFISIAGVYPLEGFFLGELVELQATVKASAPVGASAINLAESSRDPSRFTQLNEGWLTLIPAPTNAANDPTDGLLTIVASATAPGDRATATLVGDQLLVKGTTGDDRLFVFPISETEVRVRAGNRLLGTFPMPAGVAIDALTGSDYIVVDPRLNPVVIATAADMPGTPAQDDIIFAGPNAQLVDSPLDIEDFGSGDLLPPAGQPGLSAHDLALLQLLDQFSGEYDDNLPMSNLPRRRR